MNILKLLSGMLGATLLMCYDFYQEWTIWHVLPKWTWMIIGFALLLFSVFAPALKSKLSHFYVEVAVMIYLVLLIIVLPFIGGHSSAGFSIKKPFVWIVILLTIWQLISYRKKIIKEMKENKKK